MSRTALRNHAQSPREQEADVSSTITISRSFRSSEYSSGSISGIPS